MRLGAEALLAGVPGPRPPRGDPRRACRRAGAERLAHLRAADRRWPARRRTRARPARRKRSWSCRAPTPSRSRATSSTCCGTAPSRSCSPERCATRPWPGADGPANLLAAVTVAADPRFRELGRARRHRGRGALRARSVHKVHTTRPHAFASPDSGPLGVVVEGRPTLLQRPAIDAGHPAPDRCAHRSGPGAHRRPGRGPGGGRRTRWRRRRAGGGSARRWSRARCAGRTAGLAGRRAAGRAGQPGRRRASADRRPTARRGRRRTCSSAGCSGRASWARPRRACCW